MLQSDGLQRSANPECLGAFHRLNLKTIPFDGMTLYRLLFYIMNLVHTFSIRVPDAATQSLSRALHSHHGHGPGQKLRRTVLDARTSRPMRTFAQVTITEPGETTNARWISFELKVDFVAFLLESNGFTDNVFLHAASIVMVWFRDWLAQRLYIDPSILDLFTEDHLQLQAVTGQYLFEANSDTDAFRWYMSVLQHCKVVLDTGRSYPGRKSTGTRRPKVRLSEASRQAFTIDLEHLPHGEIFGQALVSLLIDKEDFPGGFATSEIQEPKVLRGKAGRLLCVVVTVDVAKRLHFGDETDVQLPTDFRQWTRENLPQDPFQMIWEALRYALWLNLRMPTTVNEISRDELTPSVGELLDLYLADGNLRRNTWIADENDEQRYRGRLINAVGVDSLTPWAFAQLNQSAVLGERMQYENRFVPSNDPDLSPHTLSSQNIQARVQQLQENMIQEAELRAKQQWPNRPLLTPN